MSTVGDRLKEERKRLGLNQTDLAAAGGVQKNAQGNYEADLRSPDAGYLAAVAAHGIDVQYVLTGERSSKAIAPDEQALLAAYRALDARGKLAAIGALTGLQQPASGSSIRVGGDVGQYFEGNQTGAVSIDMSKGRKKRT